MGVAVSEDNAPNDVDEHGSQESVSGDDTMVTENATISAQAINIASSIVGSCLAQLCE